MSRRRLFRAAGIIDAHRSCAPGAILVDRNVVVAAGSPESIGRIDDVDMIDESSSILLPALVNAHAHLDLSHLPPEPYSGDFTTWIGSIRARRLTEPEAIRRTVEHGAGLARAGGTGIIGDIAGIGSLAPLEGLRSAGLAGVGFVEVFGLGAASAEAAIRRFDEAAARWGSEGDVRLGCQPHAPYSCGVDVYAAAAGRGLPVSSHVAETLEELRLIERGDGPLADMLDGFGISDRPGRARHPVTLLGEPLAAAPWLLAHLNYVDDESIAALAQAGATIAYCPRASAYFGHPHGGHPGHAYRAMLEAGLRVALGTDGLPCLDTHDRISVLDEMRLLFARDGAEPERLMAMATTNGAAALGFSPGLVTLDPGPTLGVLAVDLEPSAPREDPVRDPGAALLGGTGGPRWVVGPVSGAE